MLGVDPSLIVADDQVALIRKGREQQQQLQQLAASAAPMKDMAQAASTMAQIPGNQFAGYGVPGVAQ